MYPWYLPEPEVFWACAPGALAWPTGWVTVPLTDASYRQEEVCKMKIIQARALPIKRGEWFGTHGLGTSLNLDSHFLWPWASSLNFPVAIKQKRTSTILWRAPQSHQAHNIDSGRYILFTVLSLSLQAALWALIPLHAQLSRLREFVLITQTPKCFPRAALQKQNWERRKNKPPCIKFLWDPPSKSQYTRIFRKSSVFIFRVTLKTSGNTADNHSTNNHLIYYICNMQMERNHSWHKDNYEQM